MSLLCAMALWVLGQAQATESEVEAPEASDDGRSWMVVPGAFYAQETSLGVALFGNATFPVRGGNAQTWPSSVSAAVVGTLERQASLAVWPVFYLGPDNQWIVEGEGELSHFPTRYFGIGGGTEPSYQAFTRRWVRTEAAVLRHVRGSLYAGPVDALSVTGVRDISEPVVGEAAEPTRWREGPVLGSGAVPGDAGSVVHGIGAEVRHEGRDNNLSARTGRFVAVRLLGHARPWGSGFGFSRTEVDLRAYHTWSGDWTLAGQLWAVAQWGEVPFTHMAELGGDNILRGLFQGRFRDHSASALQGELRFPLFWQFRGVVFADAGQVFRSPEQLWERPPRWTAGGGLRFELDAASHSTVRLDFGGGPDGSGLILQFGEAF